MALLTMALSIKDPNDSNQSAVNGSGDPFAEQSLADLFVSKRTRRHVRSLGNTRDWPTVRLWQRPKQKTHVVNVEEIPMHEVMVDTPQPASHVASVTASSSSASEDA